MENPIRILLILGTSLFIGACSPVHDEKTPSDGGGDKPQPKVLDYAYFQKNFFQAQYCLDCHGDTFNVDGDGIDLRTYEGMINPFDEYIVPGDPNRSSVYKSVAIKKDMPKNKPPVPDELIEDLKKWILAGAPEFVKKADDDPDVDPDGDPDKGDGDGGDKEPVDLLVNPELIDYNFLQTFVFGPKCMNCHSADNAWDEADGVDLGSYESMIGAQIVTDKIGIVPNDLEKSAVYTEVLAGDMPKGRRTPKLSEVEIAWIKLWIEKGAPETVANQP